LRDAQVAVAVAAQSKLLLFASTLHPLRPFFKTKASVQASVMHSVANASHQGAGLMICKCDGPAAAGQRRQFFCKCSIGMRGRFLRVKLFEKNFKNALQKCVSRVKIAHTIST
jgi:hypothetical protein